MKIPYFPGCTLKTNAKNYEDSAIAVAKQLGLEFVEIPRWNCCGVVYSLTSDDIMHHIAPIRNFLRVLDMNRVGLVENEKRLLTLCSMCFNTLSRSNLRVKENPDDLETINDTMYLEEDYDGSVEVVHFLQILRGIGFDKVKERVTKPLKNLKVAPYYGCMLLRPKEVGIDDPESPEVFEELINSLGAEAVDWELRSRCCGSYLTLNNKDAVVDLCYEILSDARYNDADVVITACPLCAFNLDNRQKEIKAKYPAFEQIPVLYFTQLMAIAFDLEKITYGFDLNYVDPEKLFQERKLVH